MKFDEENQRAICQGCFQRFVISSVLGGGSKREKEAWFNIQKSPKLKEIYMTCLINRFSTLCRIMGTSFPYSDEINWLKN